MVHETVGEMGDNSGWVTRIMDRSSLTHDPLLFTYMQYFVTIYHLFCCKERHFSRLSACRHLTALCNGMFPELVHDLSILLKENITVEVILVKRSYIVCLLL